MSDQFQLREVFNKDVVAYIGSSIQNVYPDFESTKYYDYIMSKLDSLSFGDRSSLITEALEKFLPKNYEIVADILLRSLGPEIGVNDLTGYDGFYIMPMGNFVSRNGKDYFDVSMNLLYEMTKRFTSEGPIRTFIKLYPKKSLRLLHKWAEEDNAHVRRLVSEGTRPRLPLSSPLLKFVQDPTPVIELLTKLKSSPELYVRRSIANNLNDIAKDNPNVVTQTLNLWKKQDESKNMQWLIQHALRTLLKQGNPEALELLGYSKDPPVEILNFTLQNEKIQIGEKLSFEFDIENRSEQPVNLMIDFIIYFMKHNGRSKPKVFKLAKKQIEANKIVHLTKSHAITQLSTRKIYPGDHQLQLQINGKKGQLVNFYVS
ncbi:MAG: DNA alkylation repair protein [Candidatus Kariarchaeaceae archaeon]|jgi:3-methyladenine DNA glycosylase AlkC